MPHAVFVCYAMEDKSVAEKLCAALERNRIRCWIAPRDVLPGTSYPDAIAQAIAGSRVLVLVLSQAASASPYVLREVEQAVSQGRPILPFRITGDSPADGLRFLIASSQWLDASAPPLEPHLEQAAVAVKALLESGESAAGGSASPQAPVQTGLTFARLLEDPTTAVGQAIGSYRLESFEGQGGSGWVFRGGHSSLGTEAAVKLLRPLTVDATSLIEPLQSAVRALASIHNPSVAQVLDFGTLVLLDGSSFYLITAFIRGETLDRWAHATLADRRRVASSLAAAVRDMHDLRYFDPHGIERVGLLHGDLKPSNVILRPDGTPVLVDFLVPDIQRALTKPGGRTDRDSTALFGTPGFMAPEREREGVLTTATDVYALGMTLRYLFRDVLDSAHLEWLKTLLDRMTRSDPAERPSAGEVVAWLSPKAAAIGGRNLSKMPSVIRARRPLFLSDDETLPRAVDENVQFTVYRPRVLPVERWQPVIAFAHLSERRPAEPDAVDPIAEIDRQARQILGDVEAFRSTRQDASQGVPREGALTFVLELPGMQVNPRTRAFSWTEDVHHEEFRVLAPATLAGRTVRGSLTAFLGSIILGDVPLAIGVVAQGPDEARVDAVRERAACYRRIFASYSRMDLSIVRQFELFARVMGDEYLRDLTHLRAGEVWSKRIPELIQRADVFQLFWSSNSMRSPFVRREWEYALALNRRHFVRPTYWEDPMPCSVEDGLPPPALLALHFERLPTTGDFLPVLGLAGMPPQQRLGKTATAAEPHRQPTSAKRSGPRLMLGLVLILLLGALLALGLFLLSPAHK